MGKRKLSRQQAWRVEKIQAERARRAARRDTLAQETLTTDGLGPEQEGVVVAHYGTQVTVEAPCGRRQRCHLRANLDGLVTGDHVVWSAGENTGVVVAQLQRHSALSRPDARGRLKTIAANIDQILVVIAPFPEPHANLIDRYLVAAEAVAIEPVILLNKADLLRSDAGLATQMAQLLAPYPALGYRVLHTSTRADGLEPLQDLLRDRTSVCVGQSGVGKSSLVNRLAPDAGQRVAELSAAAGKGTHTTSTAVLLRLSCGGALIDSPGIREFGLWHMSRRDVELGFRELRPLLGSCRFRDCRHEQEPDCAITREAAAGRISAQRLQSFRHIVAGLEDATPAA